MLHTDFGDGLGYVAARRHVNGGGLVAVTAHVDDSVYLAAEAMVFGHARITDNVRITGRAKISGKKYPCGISTLIEGNASICGNVEITCCALVADHAEIRGNVKLFGGVQVLHHAIVSGDVELSGDVLILDQSFISGNIKIIADDKQILVKGDDNIQGNRVIKSLDQLKASIITERSRRRGRSRNELDIRGDRVLGA